ncbi:MAG: hypothetical protein AVDCRST_MAG64-2387, partial [uncultured Phycisphaerae bacterium]
VARRLWPHRRPPSRRRRRTPRPSHRERAGATRSLSWPAACAACSPAGSCAGRA